MQRRRERVEKKKANAAWSNKVVKKEVKVKRQVKKDKKRESLKESTTEQVLGEKRERAASDEVDEDAMEDDWGELAREERMAKKVKKGLVSQDAFDGEFGEL